MILVEKNSQPRIWRIFYSILICLSSLCAILCCFISFLKETYVPIIWLPIVLTLVLLINKPNKDYFNNLSIFVCNIVFFFRYGFYPLSIMYSLDEAYIFATNTEVILLMIYEFVAVNIIIAISAKRLNVQRDNSNNNTSYSSRIGIVAFFLIVAMFLSVLIEPSLLKKFSLSIEIDKTSEAVSFVNTLFQMGLWALVVFLVVSLRYKDKGKTSYHLNFFLAVCLCVYYLLFNMVSSSNVHRWKVVVGCLSLGFLLSESFPARRKTIIKVSIIGIVLGVFFGTFVKFNSQVSMWGFFDSYVGNYRNLDEYFSGIRNIQNGLNMIKATPESKSPLSTLTDFFSGMPIISRLFVEGSKNSTIIMYQNYMGRKDIICPLMVQSIAHFSIVGAPIMSMIMMILAIEFNRLQKKTSSMYVAFVCIEIVFYCSLFMGMNTMIILGVVWIRLLFILIMKFNYPIFFNAKRRN